MPLEVKLGKTLVTLPKQKLKWVKVGTFSEDKILFILNIDGRCNGWGDALLFTSDMKFDPNKFDALTLGQLAREVKPVPEFGELLLQKNPNISPEDFAKQMLKYYGFTYRKPGKVVDENNNILVDGKPFFPILAYGLNPDNPRYYDTGCNTSHWVWKGWKHSTDKYVVGGRDRFAYDRQVRDFLNYNPKNVAFIHLFDEPENHLHPELQVVFADVIVELQRIYDLTVLITTHSPYFLQSLELSARRKIVENGKGEPLRVYQPKTVDGLGRVEFEDITNDTSSMYRKFAKAMRDLELERMQIAEMEKSYTSVEERN
jgi:hypothetical protein